MNGQSSIGIVLAKVAAKEGAFAIATDKCLDKLSAVISERTT